MTCAAFAGCAIIRGGARHPVLPAADQQLAGNRLRISLAALAGMGAGEVREVKPGGGYPELLLLAPTPGGVWRAVTAHCPHKGCVVGWNATAHRVAVSLPRLAVRRRRPALPGSGHAAPVGGAGAPRRWRAGDRSRRADCVRDSQMPWELRSSWPRTISCMGANSTRSSPSTASFATERGSIFSACRRIDTSAAGPASAPARGSRRRWATAIASFATTAARGSRWSSTTAPSRPPAAGSSRCRAWRRSPGSSDATSSAEKPSRSTRSGSSSPPAAAPLHRGLVPPRHGRRPSPARLPGRRPRRRARRARLRSAPRRLRRHQRVLLATRSAGARCAARPVRGFRSQRSGDPPHPPLRAPERADDPAPDRRRAGQDRARHPAPLRRRLHQSAVAGARPGGHARLRSRLGLGPPSW